MWSLGVVILELCIQKPLFMVHTKEELYEKFCSFFSNFDSSTVFLRSKFRSYYRNKCKPLSSSSSSSLSSPALSEMHKISHRVLTATLSDGILNIQRIFESHQITGAPHSLIALLAGMLQMDPNNRFTPLEALSHSFFHNSNTSSVFNAMKDLIDSNSQSSKIVMKNKRKSVAALNLVKLRKCN